MPEDEVTLAILAISDVVKDGVLRPLLTAIVTRTKFQPPSLIVTNHRILEPSLDLMPP